MSACNPSLRQHVSEIISHPCMPAWPVSLQHDLSIVTDHPSSSRIRQILDITNDTLGIYSWDVLLSQPLRVDQFVLLR